MWLSLLIVYFCSMKALLIAIDGYAATGKSTTARQVAQRLDYTFMDTGAMYRAVTLFLLDNEIPIQQDAPGLLAALEQIHLEFRRNPVTDKLDMFLNGADVEEGIRSMRVSDKVSEVATISAVRRRMVALQRKMGEQGGYVVDGRDIGTVVFPNAELKIFLTARMDVRVQRRLMEMVQRGKPTNQDDVRDNLLHRDHIDSTREDSPLRRAEDAIEIDTSSLTIEDQVNQVVSMAQELLREKA